MTEERIYKAIPDGWRRAENTGTAPDGCFWINNGKSLFDKEYKQALYREDKSNSEK